MRNDGWHRLVLMRHAKSDWSTHGQADHDRPLNQRGRLAAPMMGAWIVDIGLRIDLAMVSTAARAQETWTRLAPLLQEKPVVWKEKDLYHADPGGMLQVLRRAPDDVETILMIGHNPGLEQFGGALTPSSDGDSADHFPTAATGVFRLEEENWRKADFGSFTLEAYARPKSLI